MILTAILGLVLGWREVQNVIHKVYFEDNPGGKVNENWKYTSFIKAFWWTKYKSIWKNWDSFHFISGLAVLIISYLVQIDMKLWFADMVILRTLTQTITLWVWIMYWRNVSLHVIFPKKKQYKYLLPLIGGLIK